MGSGKPSWVHLGRFLPLFILVTLPSPFTSVDAEYVFNAGRHICVRKHHLQAPVRKIQTYCKPVYRKEVRMCERYRLCTSFRVVYKMAQRSEYQMRSESKMVYSCCPGWTQLYPRASGCMKPICSQGCNDGRCIKPELCECPAGWSGRDCKTDTDECKTSSHGCKHKCKNTVGSYHCSCHEGFKLASDGKSCEFCLDCVPEYKHFMKGYRHLINRVNKLEHEKKFLQGNVTKMAKDYGQQLDKLKTDIAAAATVPSQTEAKRETKAPPIMIQPDSYDYDDDDGFYKMQSLDERLRSLSMQISLLEERLEVCTCNREGRRPGT